MRTEALQEEVRFCRQGVDQRLAVLLDGCLGLQEVEGTNVREGSTCVRQVVDEDA